MALVFSKNKIKSLANNNEFHASLAQKKKKKKTGARWSIIIFYFLGLIREEFYFCIVPISSIEVRTDAFYFKNLYGHISLILWPGYTKGSVKHSYFLYLCTGDLSSVICVIFYVDYGGTQGKVYMIWKRIYSFACHNNLH